MTGIQAARKCLQEFHILQTAVKIVSPKLATHTVPNFGLGLRGVL